MTAILYPVADNAEQALHAPQGHAARAREAARVAGAEVAFRTELVGPAFQTEAQAWEAYFGPGRPGGATNGGEGVGEGDGSALRLAPVSVAPGARIQPRPPARPVFRDGRRWPQPAPDEEPVTLWRLSVSFWKVVAAAQPRPGEDIPPARHLRRDAGGRDLPPEALRALAEQTLRPMQPQQPLDIGLFEVRLPESPDVVMPDE